MLEDIAGMTFLEVDRIAMDQGVAANDCERITAGVTYMLGLALSQGHSCVPIDSLAKNTVPLLHLSIEIHQGRHRVCDRGRPSAVSDL